MKSMRYLSAFFILLCGTFAYSQNAPPHPLPQNAVSKPPDQKAESATQQADTQQRGTEKAPFVIKILPPMKHRTKPKLAVVKGQAIKVICGDLATKSLLSLALSRFSNSGRWRGL